jgi:hypothetical protein
VEFVKNGIALSQRQYVEKIVRTFSFHKENVYTPIKLHSSTSRKFLESEDELICSASSSESSMQLATWSRPDVSYSVSILSQFFSNPARRHRTLARKVVNYLKTTYDSVLFLSSEPGSQNCSTSLTVILFAVKKQEKADLESAFSFVIR